MTVKNEACEENTKNLPEIQIRRVGFGSFKTSVDLKHPQKCMGTSRVWEIFALHKGLQSILYGGGEGGRKRDEAPLVRSFPWARIFWISASSLDAFSDHFLAIL